MEWEGKPLPFSIKPVDGGIDTLCMCVSQGPKPKINIELSIGNYYALNPNGQWTNAKPISNV